jgi:CoA-dependent NAD(P)H sulfur oxidoreductase
MKKGYRILVVGGLAAGPSAASKAKRINPGAEVVLIEKSEYISYGICEIPYYLGGEYNDKNHLIVYSPKRLAKEKGVTVRIKSKAEEIQSGKRSVTVRDMNSGRTGTERYDKLIIATGSKPKMLPFEGSDCKNFFTIKSLQSAYGLRDFLSRHNPRNAVVVGGGYIGLEMTETLKKIGCTVTLFHRHNYPFTGIDKSAGEKIIQELVSNKIHFVPHTEVTGFETTRKEYITAVATSSRSYPADIVICAIGVTPSTEFAATAEIRTGSCSGIITDEKQRTNLEDIYAAGDCCELRNIASGKSALFPLATVASKTGRVAGENAAGGDALFNGTVKNIAVRLFGLEISRIGLTMTEAKEAGFKPIKETITAYSRVAGMPHAARLTVTLIADKAKGRLLGGFLVGPDGAAHRGNILAALIRLGLTLSDLSELDLMYAPPFSPLWDPLLIAANQSNKKIRGTHGKKV